jgi:adenylate cyclase
VCFDIGFKAFAVTMSPYIAEQYFRIGEGNSAITWIEKIMAHVNVTGSHVQTAELFRIKGLSLQALNEPEKLVEKNLKLALALSRKQSAKTYELRAAVELAQLWQTQGKSKKAHDLLKNVYDWFSEGYDSVDLQQGKIILDELDLENTLQK